MRLTPPALLLNDAYQPHRSRAGLVLRSQAMSYTDARREAPRRCLRFAASNR